MNVAYDKTLLLEDASAGFRVMAGNESISVAVSDTWGRKSGFISLTPASTLRLAEMLKTAAEEVKQSNA